MITAERVKKFAPNAVPELVVALVQGWPRIRDAGINTPLRVAHFLTQLATETGEFTLWPVVENMNYSAKRLTEVWPSHFPSTSAALPYSHNPERLANYIYDDAHRSESFKLGNTHPGDGWRYRGRGFIQTTGRDGYRNVGHEDDPDALLNPAVSLDAAIQEFVRTKCTILADRDDLETIRRKINGGSIGIERARVLIGRAKTIFTAMPEPATSSPTRPPAPPQAFPNPRPADPPPAASPGPKEAALGIGALIAGGLAWAADNPFILIGGVALIAAAAVYLILIRKD